MTETDFVAVTGFISGAFIGAVAGLLWERHGWVKACVRLKLARYDGATGKLIWVCDRSAVP